MKSLDEAIRHCEEVAEKNEAKAQKIGFQFLGTTKDREATECRECAAEHRQLAEWLMEYKDLKAEQNDQYVFIRELMDELKEAKRLLKLAILDFSTMYDHIYDCDGMCESCPIHGNRDTCDKWRYADEVKKLLEVE